MRLYLGVANKLTVYNHAWLCEQLFQKTGTFHLPGKIIPLYINSARDQILMWMLDCNANGVKAEWLLPSLEDETDWFSSLEEEAVRKETDFTKGTTQEEQQYILSRLEEARRIKAALTAGEGGSGGPLEEEHVDEEIAKLEVLAVETVRAEVVGVEVAGAEAAAAPEEEGLEVGPRAPEQKRRLRRKGS